ncbi:MAG: hypothetical protein WB822_11065, partial [Rhodoplanes sp.]
AKLAEREIAFSRVSDLALFARHPHLHRITVGSPVGPQSYPGPPRSRAEPYGPVPSLGEHTEKVRREFTPAQAGSIE